jgi:Na+-transporting methylmalonyl-CoA/oxaloacetate decarboxylase gamma subunit
MTNFLFNIQFGILLLALPIYFLGYMTEAIGIVMLTATILIFAVNIILEFTTESDNYEQPNPRNL